MIGGGDNTNSNGVAGNVGLVTESRRTDNGWRATIFADGAGATQLTAYAYCLEANG